MAVVVDEGEEVQLESSVARLLGPGAAAPDLTRPAIVTKSLSYLGIAKLSV